MPTLAIVPLVVGHAALVLAGWLLGARLLRAGRQRLAIAGAVGLGAALVLAAALALPRLVTAASYAGHHHGVGRGLMSVELGGGGGVAAGDHGHRGLQRGRARARRPARADTLANL